ncbi:MAG TPA: hypothetical protein VGE07_26675 [Herpetosiphonaceae bacterium]
MSNEIQQPMIHIRFQGQSWRFELARLNLAPAASDDQVRQALANHFDVAVAKFAPYVVERHANGNLTVRPEAVFG